MRNGAGALLFNARIMLPLLLPGTAGGWVLAFITSLDDVTVTILVALPALIMAAGGMMLLDRVYGPDRLLAGR